MKLFNSVGRLKVLWMINLKILELYQPLPRYGPLFNELSVGEPTFV